MNDYHLLQLCLPNDLKGRIPLNAKPLASCILVHFGNGNTWTGGPLMCRICTSVYAITSNAYVGCIKDVTPIGGKLMRSRGQAQ